MRREKCRKNDWGRHQQTERVQSLYFYKKQKSDISPDNPSRMHWQEDNTYVKENQVHHNTSEEVLSLILIF